MSPRVLITDDVHPVLIDGLKTDGYLVDYLPDITLDQVIQQIEPYAGIVINTKTKAFSPLLYAAANLRFIARLGSGLDIIDLPLAAAKGVKVFSAPEGNRNAVAEHTLGMLLALFNHLPAADREVRALQWNREANRGRELMGLTIGIIGCGNTGSSLVKKLGCLGVNVLIYDKYRQFIAEGYAWARSCSLEELKASADVISLHVPLTSETQGLVNSSFLTQCKHGVVVINTSRGAVVETRALVEALRSGSVGGACLDVFENEHPSTFSSEEVSLHKQLYSMPQVVLSPHVAGWTVESKRRIAEVLLEKIRRNVGIQTYNIPQI